MRGFSEVFTLSGGMENHQNRIKYSETTVISCLLFILFISFSMHTAERNTKREFRNI